MTFLLSWLWILCATHTDKNYPSVYYGRKSLTPEQKYFFCFTLFHSLYVCEYLFKQSKWREKKWNVFVCVDAEKKTIKLINWRHFERDRK